jgi:hypothetical protein
MAEKVTIVWAYQTSRYKVPRKLPELQVKSKTTE